MFNVSIYLDKFKTISSKKDFFKESVAISLKKNLEIDIDKKNIEIRNSILYLKINPTVKNELFMKKKYIIDELKEKNISINDIF
ncbi:MAG: hypothetical protein KGJ58_01050 [Patescibacteria group bacterium]|nr:hypothetical protein [Patescibacteria group bacterium]MDE1988174.1 hypothetical protein [Patescibacteria group bacterium]MDE2218028.1 hypothetical protein [Patescibacteria group bacterium]